jgi:hypothetical protein
VRPWGRPDLPLERIYQERIEPTAATSYLSPPPVERQVDLSPVAGGEAMFLFRTLYEGRVGLDPLDFKGFAQIWQDPQVESPLAP